MGQRHQLYLVARVIPHGSTDNKPYYRSIGGFHHQWCYGTSPLSAALRTINLLKNPINAKLVSAEIENLQHKYSRTDTEGQLAIPNVPCPYTLFLAASAFCVDLEHRYVHPATITSMAMSSHSGCWDGDNDDGLTIIDITNPFKPAYAFVRIGHGPVCAEDYVRAYCPLPNSQSKLEKWVSKEESLITQELIPFFDEIPFLTEALLAEAWPQVFGPTKDPRYRQREATKEHIIPKLLATATDPVENIVISSLADLVISPAISRSIQLGDTTDLELLLPAKAGQMRDALQKLDPFPEPGVALLSKVVGSSGIIDLSGFSLTPTQLATFASSLPASRRIEAVILSHSPNVTVKHLRSLLETRADINRIEIINTSISIQDIRAFLGTSSDLFKRVSDVILLPDFLARFLNKVPHPGAFNVLNPEGGAIIGDAWADGLLPVSFWTPDKIVSNLIDLIAVCRCTYGTSASKGIPIQTAMATGSREGVVQTTSWGERSITAFPQYQHPDMLTPSSWCFVLLRTKPMDDRSGPKYAFAKLTSKDPAIKFDVYSFKDFLKEMKKEGRGPLPPDDVVEKFDAILAGNLLVKEEEKSGPERFDLTGLGTAGTCWLLFTEEELVHLFESVLSNPQLSWSR